jgi:cytochrome c oxidase accessory protein FixG
MEDVRVLPTINADGSRARVRPRRTTGRFTARRRVVAYALIALYLLLPYVTIGGRPAMLIDLASREIDLFGGVFRPSDTVSLMMLGLAIAFGIVLVTAWWGRVWCGWACPQTVWLEWVFRPIERLFEGTPAQQRAIDARGGWSWRRAAKLAVYAALAFALASTFLAYFVGAERVAVWSTGSPAAHPAGFAVVMITSALVFFDFGFFREQTCTFACPYGRLQSVLLDRQSMIVAYDAGRGEPRGRRRKLAVVQEPGACVDCSACVQVCPTGIDIRRGLQMECIGCAQCVDACDAVMDKLGQPRGLILYSSQAQLAGEPRRALRARTLVYPALLAAALIGLFVTLTGRAAADVWLEKAAVPYMKLDDGTISTPVELRVENRTDAARRYTITLDDPSGRGKTAGLTPEYRLDPRKTVHIPFFVLSPPDAFQRGRRDARVIVRDDTGWSTTLPVVLLGPESRPEGAPR